jgi:hypothetical protein
MNMDNLRFCCIGAVFALVFAAASRDVSSADSNLTTCLDGRYPRLCNHGSLTKEQASRVAEAERRANLTQCLDGRYPGLCNHGMLAEEEAVRVSIAEHRHHCQLIIRAMVPG